MITDKEYILQTVCFYYGIETKCLLIPNRKAEIVKAKQIYFYLSSIYTKSTFDSIAKKLNNHHTTAIHGINKIKNQLGLYYDLNNDVENIKSKLYENHSLIPENIDLLRLTENYTNSFVN